MIRLLPMPGHDFPAWLDTRIALDAKYKVEAEGYSPEEAETAVREEYAELLPEGTDTPDQHLYNIEDSETGTQVGAIWFEIGQHVRRAFDMDFIIYEPFRRRGYGAQALRTLEEVVRGFGQHAIGLHVLGSNATARGLYARSGYEVTNLYAARSLETLDANTCHAVELRSMNEEAFAAYRTGLVAALAREQVRAGRWGTAYAVQLARQDYAERLREGPHTPDQFFFTLAASAFPGPIGMVWFSAREFRGPIPRAVVQDLQVYPIPDQVAYQAATIRALESKVRELGLAAVVFHLFPDEPLARLLLDELGYQAANVFMTRVLEDDGTAEQGQHEKTGLTRPQLIQRSHP